MKKPARLACPEPILPRLIKPGLDVVFVGFNPGAISAARGHYYANPANRFYFLLHSCGLTPRLLAPAEDVLLPGLGIGVTDLCPWRAGQPDVLTKKDVLVGREALLAELKRAAPRAVAFGGLTLFALIFGRKPRIGLQPERLGASAVFALPSASGRANKLWRERLEAYRGLAHWLRRSP